ncbi:MAG: GAF domain-containing protein [Bacteroidetes bacterium]|jgi:GAF domain-containing protein|nr:GAF domain-containing protein [Bacteroidota bacterium]
MEQIRVSSVEDRAAVYKELLPQLESLMADEPDSIANAANLAAALKQTLYYASWVGFYFLKNGELVLGPFQGKVACTRIKVGKGVCGTAAAQRKTVIVPNVYEFPDHIFCDPDSKSEIVLPLIKNGELIGVLDLDSSEYGSFDDLDARNLELVAVMFSDSFSETYPIGNGS